MDAILNLFDFASATWGTLVARFAVMLVLTVLIVWLSTFIMLLVTKKKEHKVAFTNWFKYCFLWAIIIAIVLLGIVAILTIRNNGLFYFGLGSLGFNLYCGYLLMCPEFLLLICWVVVFSSVSNSIKKSI